MAYIKKNYAEAAPAFDTVFLPRGHVRTLHGYIYHTDYLELSRKDEDRVRRAFMKNCGLPCSIWFMSIKSELGALAHAYYRGGSENDRLIADMVFLHNVRIKIRQSNFLKSLRDKRAAGLYSKIRAEASRFFNYKGDGR